MISGDDPRRQLGADGESEACRLLRRSGYRILERNYRTRWGELDAVAFQDGELVFVEVRSRTSPRFGSGAESVGGAKRRQLVKMAGLYLAEKDVADRPCRFDVVEMEMTGGGKWKGSIIRDAFDAS